MSTQPNASATTPSVRLATVRVHSLFTLIGRGVGTIPEHKRDAINAIRIPVFPGDQDAEIAGEIETRVSDILAPHRHRHGNAVFVRPFALDRVMERPATRVAEVGATDGVHGVLLFGEREIGVIRVIPDPDAEVDVDPLQTWIDGGVFA